MGMDREDKSDRCTVQGISYEGTDTVAASLTWASWRHPIKLGCRRWWVCSWSGPCHWQFTKCAYPLSWTHWWCTKAALITYRWWLPLTWWQPFGTKVPRAFEPSWFYSSTQFLTNFLPIGPPEKTVLMRWVRDGGLWLHIKVIILFDFNFHTFDDSNKFCTKLWLQWTNFSAYISAYIYDQYSFAVQAKCV